jgi:peptide/nickel transport system permease protein
VLFTLNIGSIILTVASLGFLGLGAQPPAPEWGTMLSEGQELLRDCPWICLFPGLMIMITVLAFNFFGDGLRDILDPRQVEIK